MTMKSSISANYRSPLGNPTAEEHVYETLLKRRSTRAFDSSPVPSRLVHRLFETARWAPSSFNEQPWRYIVTSTDTPVERERLLACLTESNRSWAKDAPILVLATVVKNLAGSGELNRYALYDLGQSVANLSTEATALGLAVHQMGGFSIEQARITFQIPDSVEPVVVLAIGTPGDPSELPQNFRSWETSPRNRKPTNETVFYRTWKGTAAAATEPD